MRNVPVTVSVPSSVTPWSMNPVHSMKRLNERAVLVGVRELSHQTIVEPHELGIVIILEHQLPWTHFRFLMEKHLRA